MTTIFIHNHTPVVKNQIPTSLLTTDSYGSFSFITRLSVKSWRTERNSHNAWVIPEKTEFLNLRYFNFLCGLHILLLESSQNQILEQKARAMVFKGRLSNAIYLCTPYKPGDVLVAAVL